MREPSQSFTKMWITVPQVCEAMGLKTDNHTMWTVGQAMQQKFYLMYRTQPPKENAKKTSGAGVHCFAHYPPDWREVIEVEILKHKPDPTKQGNLFDAEST